MAEKETQPKQKKRMEDYDFKGLMLYLKINEYEALREFCFRNRLKHSPFIRDLVVERLKKEGFIKTAETEEKPKKKAEGVKSKERGK
jgi:hypothetical protein